MPPHFFLACECLLCGGPEESSGPLAFSLSLFYASCLLCLALSLWLSFKDVQKKGASC